MRLLKNNDLVYLDDGQAVGVVQSISGLEAKLNIKMGGEVPSNARVRLLGSKHSHLPVIAPSDIADLAHFSQLSLIDFLVVPFVTSADDIQQLRSKLGPHGTKIKVLAKIDSLEAVKNFEQILSEADGVILARNEVQLEM